MLNALVALAKLTEGFVPAPMGTQDPREAVEYLEALTARQNARNEILAALVHATSRPAKAREHMALAENHVATMRHIEQRRLEQNAEVRGGR